MKVGVAASDLVSGLYATIAILAALIHQSRTGEGQQIDMALFDCQAAVLANQAMNYLAGGVAPQRMGNAHPSIVPYQVFATADGFLILAVANDQQFKRFCKAAELEPLASDARFVTNAARVQHRDALTALLNPVFQSRTTMHWIALLEKANVPCGPINHIDQVFADPQAIARGLTVAMTRNGQPLNLVASPLRLERTPPEYRLPPPRLGEHTDEILREQLGIDGAEITRLRDSGVVA
jgi:crotonobetainyl-CoA:carnitine CoA-transferase CaiB-like acyl-CoA transferase